MSETAADTPTGRGSTLLYYDLVSWRRRCLAGGTGRTEIATWTATGPERLALLASPSRLWVSLAAALAGAIVLIAAGPNAAARHRRARIVAPLSIL